MQGQYSMFFLVWGHTKILSTCFSCRPLVLLIEILIEREHANLLEILIKYNYLGIPDNLMKYFFVWFLFFDLGDDKKIFNFKNLTFFQLFKINWLKKFEIFWKKWNVNIEKCASSNFSKKFVILKADMIFITF